MTAVINTCTLQMKFSYSQKAKTHLLPRYQSNMFEVSK